MGECGLPHPLQCVVWAGQAPNAPAKRPLFRAEVCPGVCRLRSLLALHDAATTRGSNGSPVWSGQGKVIAVNSGGYLEEGEEKIAGRKTEVVKASPYKFGMRIDLVEALLK